MRKQARSISGAPPPNSAFSTSSNCPRTSASAPRILRKSLWMAALSSMTSKRSGLEFNVGAWLMFSFPLAGSAARSCPTSSRGCPMLVQPAWRLVGHCRFSSALPGPSKQRLESAYSSVFSSVDSHHSKCHAFLASATQLFFTPRRLRLEFRLRSSSWRDSSSGFLYDAVVRALFIPLRLEESANRKRGVGNSTPKSIQKPQNARR